MDYAGTGRYGAEGQNRTADTSLFRAVLCQLSYLGIRSDRDGEGETFMVAEVTEAPCVAGLTAENQGTGFV